MQRGNKKGRNTVLFKVEQLLKILSRLPVYNYQIKIMSGTLKLA